MRRSRHFFLGSLLTYLFKVSVNLFFFYLVIDRPSFPNRLYPLSDRRKKSWEINNGACFVVIFNEQKCYHGELLLYIFLFVLTPASLSCICPAVSTTSLLSVQSPLGVLTVLIPHYVGDVSVYPWWLLIDIIHFVRPIHQCVHVLNSRCIGWHRIFVFVGVELVLGHLSWGLDFFKFGFCFSASLHTP